MLHFTDKCPKCGRKYGMDKTGRIKNMGFFRDNLEELKCVSCKHRLWKKIDNNSNDYIE